MTEVAWRGELALDWAGDFLFVGQIFLGQCWYYGETGDAYAPFDEHGDPIRDEKTGHALQFLTMEECKTWMVTHVVQRLQNLELQKNMKIPVDKESGAG